MDEQVATVNITSNLIWNVSDSGIYFHCGTNQNATGNVIARTQRSGGGVSSSSAIHGAENVLFGDFSILMMLKTR